MPVKNCHEHAHGFFSCFQVIAAATALETFVQAIANHAAVSFFERRGHLFQCRSYPLLGGRGFTTAGQQQLQGEYGEVS